MIPSVTIYKVSKCMMFQNLLRFEVVYSIAAFSRGLEHELVTVLYVLPVADRHHDSGGEGSGYCSVAGWHLLLASVSWLLWSALSPEALWQRSDILFQICYGMYAVMDLVCIGETHTKTSIIPAQYHFLKLICIFSGLSSKQSISVVDYIYI